MREKVEEYEEVIINLIHTHATELNKLQQRYAATHKEMSGMAPAPRQIKKVWVKNKNGRGG